MVLNRHRQRLLTTSRSPLGLLQLSLGVKMELVSSMVLNRHGQRLLTTSRSPLGLLQLSLGVKMELAQVWC
jgi:hypothetical protein